ncbi:MAG: steroid-24-oyl-CoA synthetase [Frankiaceae bacterium]|nr:steroid-24-oyl-CoA synthetase [Frankiaceae bacterium]
MSPLSYELTQEDVLGAPMTVFAKRHSSLRALLEASAEFGARDYIVDGDRAISYADHHAAVGPVATWLAEQGVRKGDRVAILGWNSIEWVVAFWATVSLGAIAVGLNAWWSPAEISQALADCEPVLVLDDMSVIAAHMDGSAGRLPDVPIDEDDPAVILYTSGTSGRAKGAVHSHRNIVCLVQTQQHLINQRLAGLPSGQQSTLPPARILNSTPLFHVAGLHNGVVAGMGVGSATVWQPGRFDAEKTLRLLESGRCTSWSTMPTTLWRVLHHPVAHEIDTSALQHIGGGGAAWSPALQRLIREVFGPQVTWGIGYGQTECTALATSASFAELQDNPTTVGRPVATVEVGVDRSGEILVCGPMVMLGYWRNDAATRAVIDDDRWLHTGDLGEIRNGLLYLSTRRTDLILRGAENVYPAEIENCLEEHPAVDEVAVVGLPDDEFGQHVAAVVVPAAGAQLDEAELAAFVKERLAYYKVPSRWFFQDAPLPRTATGKVVRGDVVTQLGEI